MVVSKPCANALTHSDDKMKVLHGVPMSIGTDSLNFKYHKLYHQLQVQPPAPDLVCTVAKSLLKHKAAARP